MKLYKPIIIILIIFLKTETVLSENNLFNVNNIELEKKDKISNNTLTNKAIKKGFNQLIAKILLKEDIVKFSNLNSKSIKELVSYYQISNLTDEENNKEILNFSITFDKDKIHNLFFKKQILYSEIVDKELYILPILEKEDEIFIFNNNFFYDKWNKIYTDSLIEFILPLENIEIIQNINKSRNDLINLEIDLLFPEYINKNIALIFIEKGNAQNGKIYIKARIEGKKISKNIIIKKQDNETISLNEIIITNTKKELVNMIKSENLIDIQTPSFLIAKLDLNKKSNIVELNSRLKNIDLIEKVYVQEFNRDFMSLKIKYLGKLEKIINQLKNQNISLELINEQWIIKTL